MIDRIRRGDIIAGLSVAGLMLPEAVAYAGIAGLPPQRAITAAVAGCMAYALIGGSRFAIVSPTSSSAVILAATLAAMPGSIAVKAGLATLMVALAGLFFLIAAALRLGGLAGFISRPVLRGFALGLAVTIILRQLPLVTGTPVRATDLVQLVAGLIAALPMANLPSLAVGGVALAMLLLLRRYPAIPGPFLVLAAGIAASWWLALPARGVAVVGTIDLSISAPSLPQLSWDEVSRLGQFTLPLVLILFAESWGTIRTLALRHGDIVNARRELGALGVANLASALVQGMPVGAGFSAGTVSEASGAASRWTAILASLGLALLVLCAAPAIALLPQPVLAAVVIAALLHAFNPAPFRRLWLLKRDLSIALAAAAGVLGLGVLNGMLFAIAMSLAALIHRFATPHVARLGRLGDSHNFVDLSRHEDATPLPHIAIWRPTEPLFFANAERIFASIGISTRGEAGTWALVLSLEESFDLDSTALETLIEFDNAMRARNIRVQLARAHDHVRDLLARSPETDLQTRCSFSVDDAVEALRPLIADLEKER